MGGYSPCGSDSLEQGVEKVAIFIAFNAFTQRIEVTHAAKQTTSGK